MRYFKAAIKWGVYLGLARIISTQILTWLGLGTSNWYLVTTYALVALFIFLLIKNIKEQVEGRFPFMNGLIPIIVAILVSMYLFQLYMFIYVNYIDPQWVQNTSDSWIQTMVDSGVDQTVIDNRINYFKKSYQPLSMFTIQILNYGVPQMILGLIVSLFFVFKRK